MCIEEAEEIMDLMDKNKDYWVGLEYTLDCIRNRVKQGFVTISEIELETIYRHLETMVWDISRL